MEASFNVRAPASLRVAGLSVGLLVVGFGTFLLLNPPYPGSLWRSYAVPASMVIVGVVFTLYGVTGRRGRSLS